MNKRKVVVRGFQRKQGQVCASILQENGEDVIKSAATAIKCGADSFGNTFRRTYSPGSRVG